MAELRFKFDTVEVENPINWQDIKIKYERDKVVKGFFTQYTSILNFVGDAWDALITARDANLCDTIDVLVEWRCSRFDSFTTLFEGVIFVHQVIYDVTNCIGKAKIEQNDAAFAFLQNKSFEFDTADSYAGQEWKLVDSFDPPAVAYTNGIGYASLLTDLITNLVDYISESRLGFHSDYMTTAYQQTTIQLDFTTHPGIGDTISFSYNDEWGDTHVYTTEFQLNPGNTYNNFELTLLLNTAGSLPSLRRSEVANVVRSNPGGGVLERFTISIFFETFLDAASAGTGVVVLTKPQTYQDGWEDVCISKYNWLVGLVQSIPEIFIFSPTSGGIERGSVRISFDELFNMISPIRDFGFSIEKILGSWVVRIEELEHYLDPTSTVTLRDIKDMEITYDPNDFGNSVLLSKENEKENTAIEEHPTTSGTEDEYALPDFDCDTIYDRRVPKEMNCLRGNTIADIVAGTITETDQWFLFYKVIAPSPHAMRQFLYKVWDSGLSAFGLNYYANVPLHPLKQLTWNAYTLPTVTFTTNTRTKSWTIAGGFTLVNVPVAGTITQGAGFSAKIATFNRFITKADYDLIVNSQKITVNTGSDPVDDEDGFILDVNHNISDGLTRFKLSLAP